MAAPQEPPLDRLFSLGDPLPPGPQTVYGAPWRQRLFWGCYPSPDPLTALCDSLMSREGRPVSRWTAALFHSAA